MTFQDWDEAVLKSSTNEDGSVSTIEIRETYPGGNKYMYIDGNATGRGGATWSTYITYSRNSYNFTKYPMVAMDFDVMTLNGKFGTTDDSATIHLRPYYYSNKSFGSSTTGAPAPVSFGRMGLDKTPYLWQHVTVVYQYCGDGLIKTYAFINGSDTYTYYAEKNVKADYENVGQSPDTMWLGDLYITTGSWNQQPEIALDNYKQTYFDSSYSLSDVANFIYKNGNYTMPEAYKYTVATVTDTEGNTKYFDDIDKALATISDGCTLTLMEALAKTLIINNAITLNTNGFDVTVESTAGYAITATVDGVHTIEKLPSVTVKWNACPTPENCECVGGHYFANESEVILGEVPEYLFDIGNSFEVGGLVTTLLGWSYENDGTVDDLTAVTKDDADAGVLYLYPVFEQAQYDFSLDSKGTITYWTADQYKELMAAAEVDDNRARTVKLLRDVTVYDSITFSRGWSTGYVQVVLDLNGNTFTRIYLVGDKYKFDGTTYVADGTIASTTDGGYAFYCSKPSTTFTVTSSADEKGSFVTYTVSGSIYYDANGEFERYEANKISKAHFIKFYNSSGRNINLSNINIYAGNILDASGGSNNSCKLTIDNCNYYATYGSDKSSTRTLYFESSSTSNAFVAEITNSLFYYPSQLSAGDNQFMRPAQYKTNASNYKITIDNCDFVGMKSVALFGYYSTTPNAKPTVTVSNSRLYNVYGNDYFTTQFGEDVVYTGYAAQSTILPGYVSAPASSSKTYTVPEISMVTIDTETSSAIFSTATKDISVSFTHEVMKASESEDCLTDIRFSMLYYTNFNMVIYVPVADGVTEVSLSGFTKEQETVKIDGNEYYVFVKESTTTGVSDTVTAKLSYNVNGGAYRQTYNLSALVYADLILNDPWMDVETKAVANMVRYIKEARLAAGLSAGAEFDELIALGNLTALGAKADYVDTTVDYSTLAGYVSEVKFMLDGTNAAYLITLTSADVDVSVKFVDGEEIVLADSTTTENAKYTTGTRVYDIANKAIEITVTIPAADGGEPTVITGTYSVKAYINATDNTLTKAMYEFGIAAEAYRNFIIESTEND
ncbi:MAG: hypothetical protein IKV16_06455 [Clostridia bacterium]|nr:hypothetical protein [Clostridia bacterium]